jgi:hypothetical protein
MGGGKKVKSDVAEQNYGIGGGKKVKSDDAGKKWYGRREKSEE